MRECLSAIARTRDEAESSLGVVVDLTPCVLTLSAVEYISIVRRALADPFRKPVAYVVSDALMHLAHAHEAIMKRRGHQRAFFSSDLRALRWVAQRSQARDLLRST